MVADVLIGPRGSGHDVAMVAKGTVYEQQQQLLFKHGTAYGAVLQ